MSVQKLCTIFYCNTTDQLVIEHADGSASIDNRDGDNVLSEILESIDTSIEGEYGSLKTALQSLNEKEISDKPLTQNPFDAFMVDSDEEEYEF